jgi:glyoxalase family protein
VILEIATRGPGWTIDETPDQLGTAYCEPPAAMIVANRDEDAIAAMIWPEPVPIITPDMALRFGMHHITAISSSIERTHVFLSEVLGLRRVKMTSNFDDPTSAHWYWGSGEGNPGTIITYFDRNPRDRRYHYVRMGAGQTHHFAFAVPDDETQLQFREKLIRTGHQVSPVMDRVYFKSIYTRDPDGHIVELATTGPGFLVDEDQARLGQKLQLPPWLEPQRAGIEGALHPLSIPSVRLAEPVK